MLMSLMAWDPEDRPSASEAITDHLFDVYRRHDEAGNVPNILNVAGVLDPWMDNTYVFLPLTQGGWSATAKTDEFDNFEEVDGRR